MRLPMSAGVNLLLLFSALLSALTGVTGSVRGHAPAEQAATLRSAAAVAPAARVAAATRPAAVLATLRTLARAPDDVALGIVVIPRFLDRPRE